MCGTVRGGSRTLAHAGRRRRPARSGAVALMTRVLLVTAPAHPGGLCRGRATPAHHVPLVEPHHVAATGARPAIASHRPGRSTSFDERPFVRGGHLHHLGGSAWLKGETESIASRSLDQPGSHGRCTKFVIGIQVFDRPARPQPSGNYEFIAICVALTDPKSCNEIRSAQRRA